MGWTIVRKSTDGLTKDMDFSATLGDSTQVSHWANEPQYDIPAWSGLIERAAWGAGGTPSWNMWIPLGAEIPVIRLTAMTVNTWYTAFEFLCNKDTNTYIALKILRDAGSASSTAPLFSLVLVKRVKENGGVTDTQISAQFNLELWNDTLMMNLGSAYFYMGSFTYNNKAFYGAGLAFDNKYEYGQEVHVFTNSLMFCCARDQFWQKMGTDEPSGEPYSPEFGPGSEPGGGYVPGGGGGLPGGRPGKEPTFDNSSDLIPLPTKPTLSALSAQFLHAYVVTEQSLQYIGDALFPQPVFQQPDLITAMGELAQIIFFNKQVDYMLDLLILPINVPHGDWVPLNVGGRQLSTVIGGTTVWINGQPATECYVDFSCSSLSIDEYWVNFLDFTGTKIKLFLPYIGYVDIQPEYVIGGTLYVDYRFNIFDGSFMCYVRSDSGYSELEESMIGQYSGVAAIHIPLQSKDYSDKISGLISAIGTVAAGAASGGIGAAAGAGAASNMGNTIIQKPGSTHANGYNASSSFLSGRYPYLIIERQWSQFSQKYPEEVGLPSNTMQRLGDLSGLVICPDAHLDVIPASKEMKEKISNLLADGIIV